MSAVLHAVLFKQAVLSNLCEFCALAIDADESGHFSLHEFPGQVVPLTYQKTQSTRTLSKLQYADSVEG